MAINHSMNLIIIIILDLLIVNPLITSRKYLKSTTQWWKSIKETWKNKSIALLISSILIGIGVIINMIVGKIPPKLVSSKI